MAQEYPSSRQVSTTYGPIVGLRMIHEGGRQVDAFLGIPYAQPPVGPLRFKVGDDFLLKTVQNRSHTLTAAGQRSDSVSGWATVQYKKSSCQRRMRLPCLKTVSR